MLRIIGRRLNREEIGSLAFLGFIIILIIYGTVIVIHARRGGKDAIPTEVNFNLKSYKTSTTL